MIANFSQDYSFEEGFPQPINVAVDAVDNEGTSQMDTGLSNSVSNSYFEAPQNAAPPVQVCGSVIIVYF